MAEDTESPEAVELPEPVVWWGFVVRHLKKEGTAIRRAPLSVFTTAAVLSCIVYALVKYRESGVIDDLNGAIASNQSTIQNKDSQIASLEEELKSASPELAAIQARRMDKRKEIHNIYVECGNFIREGLDIVHLNDKSKEDDWIARENKWDLATEKKIEDDFGEAAAEKYEDPNSPMGVYVNVDMAMNNALSNLKGKHESLGTLISTTAFDN